MAVGVGSSGLTFSTTESRESKLEMVQVFKLSKLITSDITFLNKAHMS